jgi:acetyltransferase
MSVENLDKIFQPKSIAVVGASERKGSVGALMHNLIERGFSGEILPINPNHKKIGKLPACPSIRDLEVPVDLAVISTPITLAPKLLRIASMSVLAVQSSYRQAEKKSESKEKSSRRPSKKKRSIRVCELLVPIVWASCPVDLS